LPHSYRDYHAAVVEVVCAAVPDRTTRIIDVGAGDGSIGAAIRPHFPNTDAVEAWPPYVAQFGLSGVYRNVMVGQAQDIPAEEVCGSVVIMGDILEHLYPDEAAVFLRRLISDGAEMIVVVVPWMYEQGEKHPDVVRFGNPYEVHHQPDLTPAVFAARYPWMVLTAENGRCGMYTWRRATGERNGR
jgi:hypothetical protein